MIEERGRVVALEADVAWVETQRQSTCGSCAAKKGCGTTLLTQIMGARMQRMRVINTMAANIGDEVVIGLAEDAFLRGSLAVYAVPVAALFLGALAGVAWVGVDATRATTDAYSVVGGFLGLVGGLWWVRRFGRDISADVRYQPVLLRQAYVDKTVGIRRLDSVQNQEIV